MVKQQENSQEPSIEEILDSIRQIISDDDESENKAAAPAPVVDEPLELTERAPEPFREEPIQVEMRDPEPASLPESEPEPVFTPPPEPFVEKVLEPVPAPPVAKPAPPPPPPPPPPAVPVTPPTAQSAPYDDSNSILTKNAEDSVMGAFTELTRRAAISKIDDITVEDIVRDEIRPILKLWLDKNLPDLVEKLLAKELERISKRVIGDD